MKFALKVVGGAIALIFAISLIVALASGGGDSKVTPAPTSTAPAQTPDPGAQTKPAKPAQSERADLNSFTVDDRSIPDLPDVWLKYSITNHSSKTSDYLLKWEAVNAHGDRVANSEEYVTNVQPGQTAKDAVPTVLNTADVKINITSFDRTEAY